MPMNNVAGGPPAGSASAVLAEAALAELSNGSIGPAAVELLRQLGRQCTRSGRASFPPPEGYDRWTDDAVDHLLADMFARPSATNPDQGHRFVLDCYARATSGSSLERLLLKAIENFLKDQAKKTERGKLRRRLGGLLSDDLRFTACPADRWGLADGSLVAWQGDISELERAAFTVRGVDVTPLNKSGPTPKATVAALTDVCAAILAAAGGSVRTEDLARVLQTRFRVLRVPQFDPLDDVNRRPEIVDGDGAMDKALRARHIYDSLTDEERRLLPLLAVPEQWAAVLNVGHEVAKAAGEALVEQLRLATVDDADSDDVLLELLRLCTDLQYES